MSSHDWFGADYETLDSQRYFGLSKEQAVEAAPVASITHIRCLDFYGSTYTTELNSGRLDLLVKDGVVVKAGFF
jgi:hypothetical protein